MRRRLSVAVPYVLLSLLVVLLLTWKLGMYPLLWYDEGSRINLSRTFLETGVFATYSSNGFHPFNAWVIANPLDVLSTAGAMLILGNSAADFRLAMMPFTLLGILLIILLSRQMFGKCAGWVAALAVLAAPPLMGSGFLLIGRQNLIENSSFALLMLSFYLWFHAWDTRKAGWSWLGGIVLGLALISNFPLMIWVLPTLTLIWLGRWFQNRKRSAPEIAQIVAALIVIISWYGVSFLFTPEASRGLNLATLGDSARQQLFNGLGGKILTTTSVAMFGVMILTSWITLMGLFQSPSKQWFTTPADWKRATLGVSVLLCAFWYFFFSIGWPRYAFAGWMFTLMLLGGWGYQVVMKTVKWISKENPWIMKQFHWLIEAGLIMIMLISYGLPLLKVNGPVAVEQTAQFINTQIPPDALIETTEMELFGVSRHWDFHYPSYEYILDATKQIYFYRRNPSIPYNPVAADPDYLITGPLSDWTGLYWNSGIMEAEFEKITEFPPYTVFQRIR